MLGNASKEEELMVLKSLRYKLKNNDFYLKPFKGRDDFGMPLVMSQDEYLIRTLISIYGIKSYQDILDKIDALESNYENIKGSLTVFLKVSNKKKVSYTKIELKDITKFPENHFYTLLKQEASDAVRLEFNLKGSLKVDIVSEEEYNKHIQGTSYVCYEIGDENKKIKGDNK